MGITKAKRPSVLKNADSNKFPPKVGAPEFKAAANDVAIESIELVQEGIAPIADDDKK